MSPTAKRKQCAFCRHPTHLGICTHTPQTSGYPCGCQHVDPEMFEQPAAPDPTALAAWLHPGYPWNFNTEHWGHGSNFSPMCVGAMDIEILRKTWEPAPRVHFHSQMETPNHRVFIGKNAVVVSTEDVDMPEVSVGEIVDPRRVA